MRMKQWWQVLTIQKKIGTFTGTVFLIIFLLVLFCIWVVRFSLIDFNGILQDNAKCNELVQALEEESRLFESYIKNPGEEKEAFEEAAERTRQAVYDLPFRYSEIGEMRYAKTWSIRNSYEVYCEKRDALLRAGEAYPDYIGSLYEVYGMQDYLQEYARTLMTYTMEEGNDVYREKLPGLFGVPVAVIVFGFAALFGMLELAALMKRTIISPVMELVRAAQRIAANDFFVEDVKVWNEDELGELVHAFNKMKYATGEYILALEEKRKTLDLLHEEEMEKLMAERRLEMMKLELLKSQINPHFLFNTLNVIGGMANLEDALTTEKMIKALGSLFRYNLKTPEPEVLLEQELKVVADYMYLQQMRFGGRISYELECFVNEKTVLIPAFTFQPLVENAIIHGLAPKEEGGSIRIRIRQGKKWLYIAVGDNGTGMDAEDLKVLRSQLRHGEDGRIGIGLGNVYKRIRTMYQESRVEVFSKWGGGTVITIRIPLKEKTGEEYVPRVGGR